MDNDEKDSGPVLKRDEHNILDRDEADRVGKELIRKLLTEQRIHDKQESFHMSRTGKRDICVMMGVYIRNSVNGKIVLSDQQGFESFSPSDMYKYKTVDMATVEFPARNLPGNKEFIGKGLMSGFNVIVKWLSSIGGIR